MEYFFILGRNPQLSIAELLSYFERENLRVTSLQSRSNGLLVDLDGKIDVKKTVSELGGTIAIGRVLFAGTVEEIGKEIEKKPIYFGRENKVIYSVLNFSEGEVLEGILDAMKINFAQERLKARYKGVSGTIKLQGGHVVRGSPEKISLRDVNYFFFEGKRSAFGFIEASSSSEETEKRDIGKPVRRESLAISPRLAKILINLSQTRKSETLADPFCGVGVILQEALLMGINVVGVDIDNPATSSAKENIAWLKNNYKISAQHKIVTYDSGKYQFEELDGVATEPSLGELLTKVPARARAEETMNQFEQLMIDILNNLKKSLKRHGKMAFSAPLISTQKGKVHCNIERILEATRLRIHEFRDSREITFPIREYREGQIVGREFFVLSF